MNNIAVIPGSYDPITIGHIGIIHSATNMFDKVIVAIGNNPKKKPFIPINDRIELIKTSIKDLGEDVFVVSFDGLLVKFCEENNAKFIIRGLRSITDYEFELAMSSVNFDLNPTIQTIFIPTHPSVSMISSSVIREIYYSNGKIPKEYVHPVVIEYLNSKKLFEEAERKSGIKNG